MDAEIVRLHKACTEGDLATVKAIVGKNAELAKVIAAIPDSKYYSGNALHAAADAGKLEIAKYLLEGVKLDVNAISEIGYSPLHFSSMRGFDKLVSMLCNSGADPNLKNSHGSTALMMAASENKFAAARELLNFGADTSIKDDEGCTALHAAVNKKKCKATIELLLSFNADRSVKNSYGYTALDIARELNLAEAIAALEATAIPQPPSEIEVEAVQTPRHGESELQFHSRNWKDHRSGKSLEWLYERVIDADNGLRTRSEILEVFGEPNDEGSDDEWNYASHADDDDETFFTLHWSAENPDTLIGWKMP